MEDFEEKKVTFTLTPPAESYEGIKMGVLVFELNRGEEEKKGVSNRFYYRIGLITSEGGDDYLDSKTLNLLEAKASLVRGKKMILATLQNPEPKVLTNLELVAEVRKKGEDRVLKQKKVANYTVAPNSQFNFEIDWGGGNIDAGTYILSMTGSNGLNDWKFEKEFEITASQSKDMNDNYSFKVITPTWIKIFSIGSSLVILSIVVVLSSRRKRLEAEWKIYRKKIRRKKRRKEGVS